MPKTKIVIEVFVNKIIENKGPFSDYTDKYLGKLKDRIEKNRTYWQISNVRFWSVPIVDTNHIYAIISKGITLANFVSLTKEGFLISFNKNGTNYQSPLLFKEYANIKQGSTTELSYGRLSSRGIYKDVYDTVYKEISFDTVFKRVPIIKKTQIQKTREEQAREMADEIFSLRDYRLSLLVGDLDQLPDGKALNIMLSGINKLEKQYLEMFIGRRDTLSYRYIFTYVPEQIPNIYRVVLFKFSTRKGILPVDAIEGNPVILEIYHQDNCEKIRDFEVSQFLLETEKGVKNSGIFYRIPDKALLKLKMGNMTLGQIEMYIAQLGSIARLPYKLFLQKNVSIEFYPDLGAIKSITKQ